MKIKRYFAADMRQAIRLVREEQGPDAVILSNRKVNGGVEIVAAVDYDEALVRKMAGEEPSSDAAVPFPTAATPSVPRNARFADAVADALQRKAASVPAPQPAIITPPPSVPATPPSAARKILIRHSEE